MLYGISASLDPSEQKRFEVRKKLMQLAKKYRKLDPMIKKGLIQMEKNFLYYLNTGAMGEDLEFYLSHHTKESIELMELWKGTDSAFEKIVNGRLTVLAELKPILEDID